MAVVETQEKEFTDGGRNREASRQAPSALLWLCVGADGQQELWGQFALAAQEVQAKKCFLTSATRLKGRCAGATLADGRGARVLIRLYFPPRPRVERRRYQCVNGCARHFPPWSRVIAV